MLGIWRAPAMPWRGSSDERDAGMIEFVCPQCRSALILAKQGYRCAACVRMFPVISGIPDFRLTPDRYLSFEDERAKARKLSDFAATSNFAELVEYYYSITDDVPPVLAASFANYVRTAPHRAKRVLDAFGNTSGQPGLIDVGCGSGGALLAASGRFDPLVGVDIGLRWLVIAGKRLDEAGTPALLVCADAEALPFPDRSFTHAIAEDLIEHVRRPEQAIRAMASVLVPGGKLWVSGNNRNWPGPHPAVGIWAAGMMPKRLRSWITRKIRGVDSFRNVGFVSPRTVIADARKAGLGVLDASARTLDAAPVTGHSDALIRVVSIYNRILTVPLLRGWLLLFGPTFRIIFQRSIAPER